MGKVLARKLEFKQSSLYAGRINEKVLSMEECFDSGHLVFLLVNMIRGCEIFCLDTKHGLSLMISISDLNLP